MDFAVNSYGYKVYGFEKSAQKSRHDTIAVVNGYIGKKHTGFVEHTICFAQDQLQEFENVFLLADRDGLQVLQSYEHHLKESNISILEISNYEKFLSVFGSAPHAC